MGDRSFRLSSSPQRHGSLECVNRKKQPVEKYERGTRSYTMSHIRGKDTKIEVLVRSGAADIFLDSPTGRSPPRVVYSIARTMRRGPFEKQDTLLTAWIDGPMPRPTQTEACRGSRGIETQSCGRGRVVPCCIPP